MKRFHVLVLLGLLLGLSTFGSAQGVEPGAFVRKPAHTIESLVKQVESDPVVADRFMRHFNMPKAELISYFRTLHLAKLKESGSYLVFNVHADGVVRSRVFELKKGTLVFADANGKPILKKNCMNPLTMGELSVVRDERTEPTPTPLLPTTDIEPSEAMVAAELAQPPFTPMGTEVTPPQPFVPASTTSSVCGSALTIIPLLLIIPITNNKTECCDCVPVPEPATMSVLAAAPAAAFFARRRRKKQAR